MSMSEVPPAVLTNGTEHTSKHLSAKHKSVGVGRKSLKLSSAEVERIRQIMSPTTVTPSDSPKASPDRLIRRRRRQNGIKHNSNNNNNNHHHQKPAKHEPQAPDTTRVVAVSEDLHARTLSLTSTAVVADPTTFIFIFANPKSGNRQGRQMIDIGIQNFRLKEFPDLQVQIYDVTDIESCAKGLAYLKKLQGKQQEQLVCAAFPEAVRIARHFSNKNEIEDMCLESECSESRQQSPSPSVGDDSDDKHSRPSMEPPAHGRQSTATEASGIDTHTSSSRNEGTSTVNESRSRSESDAFTPESSVSIEEFQRKFDIMLPEEALSRLSAAQNQAIKLHAWSAGGDGTVSAVIQLLLDAKVDVNRVYFSCIPFGTGNDFSDVLGWGRNISGRVIDYHASALTEIIRPRLNGYTCKLDVYEVSIQTYEDGYVRPVSKNVHNLDKVQYHRCLMIDYFSLGVQGFVGGSFEKNRTRSRFGNILTYFLMSSKWVFLRKFPPINESLESIDVLPDRIANDKTMTDDDKVAWLEQAPRHDRKTILEFRLAGPNRRKWVRKLSWTKSPKASRTSTLSSGNIPMPEAPGASTLNSNPIEVDVQNVARLWGRDIDVWNNSNKKTDSKLKLNANEETDPTKWSPQYAGDGKLELFSLDGVLGYALNQMPNREDYYITRLAQAPAPFSMHFRDPKEYPSRGRKFHLGAQRELKPGLLFAMIDGEFFEIYKPKDIIFNRKVTLKAIGNSPEKSKLVRDTIRIEGEEAAHMPATMASQASGGSKKGPKADTSHYMNIPFMNFISKLTNPEKASKIKSVSDIVRPEE
ncbi:hypothetical protein H4219_001166 [Mycoemilia scoparia]|uniref:DAGKc domain-containing protein n=1 Tax=Mycoemilia scoparia TaxID=417184 RepID=A0A9W8DW15_9FUNG|nr:hypothetical protein H4219_001166 [Mycoemilia scoparia]